MPSLLGSRLTHRHRDQDTNPSSESASPSPTTSTDRSRSPTKPKPELCIEADADAEASPTTATNKHHKAHTLKSALLMRPTYCAICKGIMLIGGGFKCSNNSCTLYVHRWKGLNGVENCRAEAMLQHCPLNEKSVGVYKFGDLGRAIKYDTQSMVKEQVVKAAVKEQRKLGKFTKFKMKIMTLKDKYDEKETYKKVVYYSAGGALVYSIVTWIFTFSCAVRYTDYMSIRRAVLLSTLQASSNIITLFIIELVLGIALRLLAEKVIWNSEIIETFVRDIVLIDLERDVDIDLVVAAVTVRDGADWVISVALGGIIVSSGIWMKGLSML